jgi:hypothetical protein
MSQIPKDRFYKIGLTTISAEAYQDLQCIQGIDTVQEICRIAEEETFLEYEGFGVLLSEQQKEHIVAEIASDVQKMIEKEYSLANS